MCFIHNVTLAGIKPGTVIVLLVVAVQAVGLERFEIKPSDDHFLSR